MDDLYVKVNRSQLTIGAETIADSFGDEIYLAVKHGQVECPVCGAWADPCEDCAYLTCPCDLTLSVTIQGDWAKASTEDVVELADRLFIPRLWNVGGPYIDSNKLRSMYEQFIEEREQCRIQLDHVE